MLDHSSLDAPHNTSPIIPDPLPPCPYCEHPGPHTVHPGTGPHAFCLRCGACGYHLRWLSRYTPEERTQRRESHRKAAMRTQPPSAAQLAYLAQLGYHGPMPTTKLDAYELIQRLLTWEGDSHE